MFDHIGIFVSDTAKSIPFFEVCLAPLGIRIFVRQPEWGSVVFSGEHGVPFLWVGPAGGSPYYGTKVPVSEYRPMHLAFIAPSRDAVDEFHRLGIQYGAIDNGAPEIFNGWNYHAFLLDPDGNNMEATYREIRPNKVSAATEATSISSQTH